MTRRDFIARTIAAATVPGMVRAANARPSLNELVGINTSSFGRQTRATDPAQRIEPFDVPRIMAEELDVRVVDLVSTMLATRETPTLERFRRETERRGCIITNLKVNDPRLAFESEDATTRRYAIDEYKRWIEAGAVLGVRWLRPYPAAATPPRFETLVASYAELADHAGRLGITLLVENYRWLENQPDVIPRLVQALGGRIAAQPDTFNWVDHATRMRGLAAAFPHAVSADFKVRELGAAGEHPAYDLRACFALGRRAGFRGPWCIEHVHADRATLLKNLREIARMLRRWDAEAATV